MSEILPQFTDYIRKYINSNYEDLREASLELRPGKGWGKFYRSDEVYSLLFNIHANVSDNLLDLSIPEAHPSPSALVNFVKYFLKYLESHDELFDDIRAHFDDPDRISMVVNSTDEFRNDLIEVFRHALSLPDAVEILEKPKAEVEVSEKDVDKGSSEENDKSKFKRHDPSDLLSVLSAYDLEKISLFKWAQTLTVIQTVGIISFVIGVFIGGYYVGHNYQKNVSVLDSIEDKREIYELKDSLRNLNSVEKNRPKETNEDSTNSN